MPGPTPEKPPARFSGLVSSVLVLAGVFYFINSACTRGSCGSSECRPSTRVPAGAAIAITAPLDGAIISDAENAGTVAVPVVFSASGVSVRETAHCEDGTGHFSLLTETDCGPTRNGSQVRELTNGDRELTLQLAPGKYTLTAHFLNSAGAPFAGLVATTHVSVTGEQTAAGGAACP